MNRKKAATCILGGILLISTLLGCSSTGNNAEESSQETNTQTVSEAVETEAETTEGEQEEITGTTEDGEKLIFGFANNNDIYPYCAKFRTYLKEAAEREGFEVLVTDAKGDVAVQNGNIDNFIVQGASVVSAISMDLDGSIPAVEAAKNAGIPYISFLASVRDEGNYDAYIYVGSENYDAGYLQGEYLCKVLPENAQILYLTDRPSDQQYVDRKEGLLAALADREDIEIVSEMNSQNKKDLGMSITEDWLQVYDEIQCIVGQNDDSVIGAIEALKAAGRLEGVITVGLDGSEDALALIQAGEMTMSVLQDAKGQAEAGVEILKQIRDGVDPATIEDIFVPFQAVTAENVVDYLE